MEEGKDSQSQQQKQQSNLENNNNVDNTAWWESFAESCVRVTMAGFAGSLVGMAKERQQMTPPPPSSSQEVRTATTTNIRSSTSGRNNAHTSRPRRPPRMPIKTASTNLPGTWAVSCTLFALILESSRRASPTSIVVNAIETKQDYDSISPSDQQQHVLTFEQQVQRKAFTSIGDYTLGGTVAGLAGSLGRGGGGIVGATTSPLFGLFTGLGLGMFAGIVQAAIDVGDMYLEREQQQQQQQEKQQKLLDDEEKIEKVRIEEETEE